MAMEWLLYSPRSPAERAIGWVAGGECRNYACLRNHDGVPAVANFVVATNSLLSHVVAGALAAMGLE